jgi:hypothetical protein
MPKVWNRRDAGIPADAVYVGRPTKWGNPFKIGDRSPLGEKHPVLDRAGVIRWYRGWFASNSDLVEAAKRELRGKDLVCWCAPLPCHADVLLEIANAND